MGIAHFNHPSRNVQANGHIIAFIVLIAALVGAIAQPRLHAGASQASPTASAVAASIEVSGQVAKPGTLTLADLQSLPTETVDVSYLGESSTKEQHSYTGARLWDVLQLVQPKIDSGHLESSLHLYLVFTANDGYVVVLSFGEIDPEFGGQPYLLAWAEDGQPLAGEKSPVVLVTPNDKTSGRYIHGIVSIEVRSVTD